VQDSRPPSRERSSAARAGAAAGLDPEKFSGYLEAFRFGMPPHGGWGLGVDRIVQVLAGLSNIREAILFPRDRYRLDP